VVDLDETLVHSSFEMTHNPDIVIPIVVENNTFPIFVLVRPGCKYFIEKMCE
jgi:TFIIF-interacting CTD phosphatase-like protein